MSKRPRKESISETNENKLKDTEPTKKRKIKEDLSNVEVRTLDDLIDLASKYNPNKEYPVNIEKLNKLLQSLLKLKNTIGMKSVKDNIVGQIIYFLNEFDIGKSEMMHTVIQGPPGVGKTMLGKIIGELYYYLGVIKPKEDKQPLQRRRYNRHIYITEEDLDDELEEYLGIKKIKKPEPKTDEPFLFKIVKRSDLVAGYLGQTAIKTQKVLDEVDGGVLFIDEAYSLGSEDGRDSFAKEVIDTLNQNLSEKKDSLLCIIAGYKDSLDSCFFSQNEGLRRRFPFVYTIEKYTGDELCQIFKKMVNEMGWDSNKIENKFFEDNYKYFDNMGGDMETLLFMTKIEHGKRVLFKPEEKKKISIVDMDNALKQFKLNKDLKKTKDESDETWRALYN